MKRPSRYVHDDWLGYVPRPNHVEPGLTIGSAGLRMTGTATAKVPDQSPILAVGDSFTFGEEVTDTETWPSALQDRTGLSVLNGGVSGYGFDQIVLRAEKLAKIHNPGIIVVSFIADNIERTEMRRLWWRNKPWFAMDGGELKIRAVPVPRSPAIPRSVRRAELLLRKLGPAAQHWLGYHVRVHPRGTGMLIAMGLIERLALLRRTAGARIVLVAAYDAQAWSNPVAADRQRAMTGKLVDCAARCGIEVLDSFSLFASAPRPERLYKTAHMNERGNRMIASLVGAALTR
jgi:lysophospholipase L1-like esterase